MLFQCLIIILEENLDAFMNQDKEGKGKGLKILTPKQLLQRLPIALAQISASSVKWTVLVHLES